MAVMASRITASRSVLRFLPAASTLRKSTSGSVSVIRSTPFFLWFGIGYHTPSKKQIKSFDEVADTVHHKP